MGPPIVTLLFLLIMVIYFSVSHTVSPSTPPSLFFLHPSFSFLPSLPFSRSPFIPPSTLFIPPSLPSISQPLVKEAEVKLIDMIHQMLSDGNLKFAQLLRNALVEKVIRTPTQSWETNKWCNALQAIVADYYCRHVYLPWISTCTCMYCKPFSRQYGEQILPKWLSLGECNPEIDQQVQHIHVAM